MDSGSTFCMGIHRSQFKNDTIRKLVNPFRYGSNTGSRTLDVEGESIEMPGTKMKLDTSGMTSVRSTSPLVDQGFNVYFDSRVANEFVVEKDGQIWRFPCQNGLYTLMTNKPEQTYGVKDPEARRMLFEQFNRIRVLEELFTLEGDPQSIFIGSGTKGVCYALQRHSIWKSD